MANTYRMDVDWSNNDSYADTGEAVTSDLLARGEVQTRRGKDDARTLSPSSPGQISFQLNNTSRDYSPENTGSPIFGSIGPGRFIRFRSFDTAETSFQLDYPNPAGGFGLLAWCPDSAALSIAGDIDLRMKIAPERWEGCAVGLQKESSVADDTPDYGLQLTTDGFLVMRTSPDGVAAVTATSTVTVFAAGITHGQPYWIRATRDMNNGAGGNTTVFYTSPDGSSWTALGATVVNSGTTSIVDNSTALDVWATSGAGKVFTVQVRDGIAGTVRADPDFTSTTEWDAGATAGTTGSDGVNTWTLENEATIGVRHLFTGTLDDYTAVPHIEEQAVNLTGVGLLNRLHGTQISSGVLQGFTIGRLLFQVFQEAGIPLKYGPSSAWNDSSTVVPYWWWEGDAYAAAQALINSEGPGALVYEDGWGRLRFRGRHHQLTSYTSINSQATFDDDTEPAFSDLVDDRGWRNIINQVTITARQYRKSGVGAVWEHDGNINLGANEARLFRIDSGGEPFIDLVSPVEGEDYNLLSGAVTPTLSATSGPSTILTLTAGAGGAVIGPSLAVVQGPQPFWGYPNVVGPQGYGDPQGRGPVRMGSLLPSVVVDVTDAQGGAVRIPVMVDPGPRGMRVRGRSLQSVVSTVEAEDATSQGVHGVRSYELDAPWMDENTARDVAQVILNDYANPRPTVTVTFRTGNTENTRITNMLEREVTEKVTVTDSKSGWNSAAYIGSVSHRVTEGGKGLETTFVCEKAVTPLVSSTQGFVLDSSSNGILGTSLLNY